MMNLTQRLRQYIEQSFAGLIFRLFLRQLFWRNSWNLPENFFSIFTFFKIFQIENYLSLNFFFSFYLVFFSTNFSSQFFSSLIFLLRHSDLVGNTWTAQRKEWNWKFKLCFACFYIAWAAMGLRENWRHKAGRTMVLHVVFKFLWQKFNSFKILFLMNFRKVLSKTIAMSFVSPEAFCDCGWMQTKAPVKLSVRELSERTVIDYLLECNLWIIGILGSTSDPRCDAMCLK